MLRLLLVLGIIGFGTAAGFFNRYAALLLYLWFAFFRPQEWVFTDISALHLSLVVALVLIIPSLLTGRFPVIGHPLTLGMTLLVAAALVAELVTPLQRTDWSWLRLVAQSLLIGTLLVRLVDSAERLRTAIAVVACSVGFHTAKQGLIFLLRPGFRVSEGVGGSFGDNNSYAVLCAMVGLLLLAIARTQRPGWFRRGFFAAGCLSLLTVVATFSRGGLLAAVAGLLVYGLLRGLSVRWLVAAAVVAVAAVPFITVPEGYTDRLKTIESYQDDASAAGRLYFWTVALEMSADQPLGVGIQNFNNMFDRYDSTGGLAYGTGRSVHNSHLQVLTEAGFFGFAVWIFLLFYSVSLGLRIRRRALQSDGPNRLMYVALAEGITAGFIAFIVGGTFTAIAWNDFTWCLFAILAALDRLSRAEVTQLPAVLPQPTMERSSRWIPHSEGWQPASVR